MRTTNGLLGCAVLMMGWVMPVCGLRIRDSEDGKRLLLYDCPLLKEDDCRPYEEGFWAQKRFRWPDGKVGLYEGDARILYERLYRRRDRPYEEVLLYSYGGDLVEGVNVGRVLRHFQATVRVARGHRCISSCTIAFLGGLFRTVDPEATYEVHSASGFQGAVRPEILRELTPSDPKAAVNALARFAEEERRGGPFECEYTEAGLYLTGRDCNIGARGWAKILVPYFQRALLRLDEEANNAGVLRHWFRNSVPDNPYLRSAELRADAARIQREGESGAQSVLMKIERESMLSAIHELRNLAVGGRLGPKADRAIDMLEAMYSQRITGTWAIPQSLLKSMGYTVTFFQVGPQ